MPRAVTVHATGPVLLFGGPYGNLQATEAVLADAARRAIPPDHVICTGDLVAYCGSPRETIARVREAGIHVVMGNCDAQLAAGADDCGCGFQSGTACDRLSAAWYAYASAVLGPEDRAYLGRLPERLWLQIGGARLGVVHGAVSRINAFVFSGTPIDVKRAELGLAAALSDGADGAIGDGLIGGHCGLPFTQVIDGRLWHNPGVVGMPANDGTPRVWYSVLTPRADGALDIAHHALTYDHRAAAEAMRAAGLPADYREALGSGLWPSLDVLPDAERAATGIALQEASLAWTPDRARVATETTHAARF